MHDPVNIGNPRELTVLDIAKLVLKLTSSSSQITHHPLPADDPKVRRPDISSGAYSPEMGAAGAARGCPPSHDRILQKSDLASSLA